MPVHANATISLVIPCWHDACLLENVLRQIVGHPSLRDVVIAEADAQGEGQEIAQRLGVTHVPCPGPNRGQQMNLGVQAAQGEVILFHHADSQLDPAHLDSLSAATEEDWAGGAFSRKFDLRHPRLRILERLEHFRSTHFGPLFGDQSIFVRRDVFKRMGGYANIPLMEDMEFTRRMRKEGRIRILRPPIETSARRSDRDGAWRTTLKNAWFVSLFMCGADPHKLHARYYSRETRRQDQNFQAKA